MQSQPQFNAITVINFDAVFLDLKIFPHVMCNLGKF
jgi:hypothetical protein